jgi:energy-coupling factor transport system permease protein
VNPVAKILAAAALALCLVLTIDPVSAGVALVLELALFPLLGVPWATFWRRTLPVWVAAPLAALTIALYGRTSGTVYVEFLFVRISDGSLEFALATLLRVLAIALPAVVLFITIDPTDLADGLAQRLHLPARFVLGALAGVRLMGLAAEDWRSVALARRARGVADRGAIRRLFGQAFALLVLSLRRGSTLATAMEARGFGAPGERTWARDSPWGRRDWLIIAIGLAIGLIAITAAVLTGSWRPLIG